MGRQANGRVLTVLVALLKGRLTGAGRLTATVTDALPTSDGTPVVRAGQIAAAPEHTGD